MVSAEICNQKFIPFLSPSHKEIKALYRERDLGFAPIIQVSPKATPIITKFWVICLWFMRWETCYQYFQAQPSCVLTNCTYQLSLCCCVQTECLLIFLTTSRRYFTQPLHPRNIIQLHYYHRTNWNMNVYIHDPNLLPIVFIAINPEEYQNHFSWLRNIHQIINISEV